MGSVCGVVLAAGAGTRFGGPKVLARTADGTPWVVRAVAALRAGGCDDVVAVLGAAVAEARALIPAGARTVVADDWADGLSRSLVAGLDAAAGAERVVVVPVDTPELPGAAVARVLDAAPGPEALARAAYRGAPGHPVVLGAAHLPAVVAEVRGDEGAGRFLARRGARRVECGDLWSGDDIDHGSRAAEGSQPARVTPSPRVSGAGEGRTA